MTKKRKCQTCFYCKINYWHYVDLTKHDPCGLDKKTGIYACLGKSGNEYKNYTEVGR